VRTPIQDVDLLVIGGGKAGKTLAMDRAKAGQRVAMVERGMIGGSCINVACIPTKALVAAARALRTTRRAAEFGIRTGEPEVDVALLRAHKQGVVEDMVAINHKQFLDSGMDLVIGQARFTGPRTVEVALAHGGTLMLRGADVVINTGTRPALPPIPGLAEARPLTSESLLELAALPRSVIVLGGGYIAGEFAQMLNTFGARVTMLERDPQLLGREDPDIASAVAEIFAGEGIDVRTGVAVSRVTRNADSSVTAVLADHAEVTADELLVAVGREPVAADLGLDTAGVRLDEQGFVAVDDELRTTAEHTWAAGDVAGGPQFTHRSLDDYRVLKANLAGARRSIAGRIMPYTVFLTPELARVGLTERQAREAGREVRVARIPVATIPRARTARETAGMWKAVVDAHTAEILGVALLGHEAGEALTTVQTAMLAGLPYTALRDMVITHPTITEGLNLLFAAVPD
jgi:pyruvate/2-oxoglutarate dehydrogenase complex dihydrolipoamide dehydrogenase (E3) component